MAKFAKSWVFRTPLRTIEFGIGQETIDAEVLEAAERAGVLEDESDGDNRPSKGSAPRRPVNLKG